VISLATLDLIICGIIYKLCLGKAAASRVVIDPQTKQIYLVSDSIPFGKRIPSGEVNSDDEDENLTDHIPSITRDSFTELGLEGMIISQLITCRKSSQVRSASDLEKIEVQNTDLSHV
jgi:hypothetical protein